MLRSFMLSLFLFAITISVVGCGPNNETTFDPDAQPPVTQDEVKASEDYEASMKAEQAATYGK